MYGYSTGYQQEYQCHSAHSEIPQEDDINKTVIYHKYATLDHSYISIKAADKSVAGQIGSCIDTVDGFYLLVGTCQVLRFLWSSTTFHSKTVGTISCGVGSNSLDQP